jgi:MtaA/CmuA family methyltransferase
MNGHQRIAAALAGRQPDSTPVMLHNFMLAAREAGVTMSQYRRDPRQIARSHIEAVEKYGYDGILVDVDTATLAGAAGVPTEFPEDEPAVCRGVLLESLEDVDRLKPVDVGGYWGVQVWLEATRLLKQYFGDEIWVRGNCDQAAFSLACMLRGMQSWMLDIMDEASERPVRQLLDYCTGITTEFLGLMARTGADMLSNGDSSAGTSLISPRLYRQFGLPYEQRVAAFAHALRLPWALHVCGNTNLILPDLAATGADALELDFKTDAGRAHRELKNRSTFIGNIDPSGVLALGSPEIVESKTRELIDVFSDEPRFILNAGCALPATTPPENLRAMIRAARAR